MEKNKRREDPRIRSFDLTDYLELILSLNPPDKKENVFL